VQQQQQRPRQHSTHRESHGGLHLQARLDGVQRVSEKASDEACVAASGERAATNDTATTRQLAPFPARAFRRSACSRA
jgi:hypothetical protein